MSCVLKIFSSSPDEARDKRLKHHCPTELKQNGTFGNFVCQMVQNTVRGCCFNAVKAGAVYS